MLTATNIAPVLGKGHFKKKNDIIISKCGKGPKFKGNVATEWGTKFEDVAVKLYELRNNTIVREFSLIPHSNYTFLGASPDGITIQGIMLEIKCPYKRKITGIPPHHYWIQMQIQLEVCDLDYCDFLECGIKLYSGLDDYLDDIDENAPRLEFNSEELQKKFDAKQMFLRTKDGFEKV